MNGRMKKKNARFSATIYKIGINPAVDVPKSVSEVFEKRGNIPVEGFLNEVQIRATLVPIGNGRHRLYINTEMRKKAKVETGDKILLNLTEDVEP